MITNPTIETLLARRSVRAYKPEQITDEERDTILNVGVWSPTGMNNQSTRFIVVQSPEMRAKLKYSPTGEEIPSTTLPPLC